MQELSITSPLARTLTQAMPMTRVSASDRSRERAMLLHEQLNRDLQTERIVELLVSQANSLDYTAETSGLIVDLLASLLAEVRGLTRLLRSSSDDESETSPTVRRRVLRTATRTTPSRTGARALRRVGSSMLGRMAIGITLGTALTGMASSALARATQHDDPENPETELDIVPKTSVIPNTSVPEQGQLPMSRQSRNESTLGGSYIRPTLASMSSSIASFPTLQSTMFHQTIVPKALPSIVQLLSHAPGVDLRIHETLAQKLVQLQNRTGMPFIITSAYRDPIRNAAVGGAQNSAHTRGTAVDIRLPNGTPETTVDFLLTAAQLGFGGFGIYSPNFLHLDIESRRVWGADYTVRSVPIWAREFISAHMGLPIYEASRTNQLARLEMAEAPVMLSTNEVRSILSGDMSTSAPAAVLSAPSAARASGITIPSSMPSLASAALPSSLDSNDPGIVEPPDIEDRYRQIWS